MRTLLAQLWRWLWTPSDQVDDATLRRLGAMKSEADRVPDPRPRITQRDRGSSSRNAYSRPVGGGDTA